MNPFPLATAQLDPTNCFFTFTCSFSLLVTCHGCVECDLNFSCKFGIPLPLFSPTSGNSRLWFCWEFHKPENCSHHYNFSSKLPRDLKEDCHQLELRKDFKMGYSDIQCSYFWSFFSHVSSFIMKSRKYNKTRLGLLSWSFLTCHMFCHSIWWWGGNKWAFCHFLWTLVTNEHL